MRTSLIPTRVFGLHLFENIMSTIRFLTVDQWEEREILPPLTTWPDMILCVWSVGLTSRDLQPPVSSASRQCTALAVEKLGRVWGFVPACLLLICSMHNRRSGERRSLTCSLVSYISESPLLSDVQV